MQFDGNSIIICYEYILYKYNIIKILQELAIFLEDKQILVIMLKIVMIILIIIWNIGIYIAAGMLYNEFINKTYGELYLILTALPYVLIK